MPKYEARELMSVQPMKYASAVTRVGGARTNPTVSRSTAAVATEARSSRAAMPGRGARRICARPIRAIERFSPKIGETSATVPMVARSVRSRASRSPSGTSRSRSWASLKAMPLPESLRCGYRLSDRWGFTRHSATGTSGGIR